MITNTGAKYYKALYKKK